MKELVYNQKGEKVGQVELTESVFGLPMNEDLLHQVVVAQQANARKIIAHTKDRSEVRGGGRKPWRQKGTGRARHGSIRSPIWRGGGITFGPTKERNFKQKINKKMGRKALLVSLSSRCRDKEMIILDKIELPEAKTKHLVKIIEDLKTKLKKKLDKGFLLVVSEIGQDISRAIRNIPKTKAVRADNLNALGVLSAPYLVMTKGAVQMIKKMNLENL